MHYSVHINNFQDLFDLKNFENLTSPNTEKKQIYNREMTCFYLQRLETRSKCLEMCTVH